MAVDVVPIRLVCRECVEVVPSTVGEEPGEKSLPVEVFLVEMPVLS